MPASESAASSAFVAMLTCDSWSGSAFRRSRMPVRLHNPLVGGVHDFLKVGIGQPTFRKTQTSTRDADPGLTMKMWFCHVAITPKYERRQKAQRPPQRVLLKISQRSWFEWTNQDAQSHCWCRRRAAAWVDRSPGKARCGGGRSCGVSDACSDANEIRDVLVASQRPPCPPWAKRRS